MTGPQAASPAENAAILEALTEELDAPTPPPLEQPSKRGRPAARDTIRRILEENGLELRISQDRALARFMHRGHRENALIDSRHFRRFLLITAAENNIPASKNALDDVTAVLEAKAFAEGHEVPAYIRAGVSARDGRDGASLLSNCVIDPGRPDWTLWLFTTEGVEEIPSTDPRAPVFIRPAGFARLPDPADIGDFDLIWQYANVAPEDRRLVEACMVHAWRDGAKPILALVGEQGSAKTSTLCALRSFVDPSAAMKSPLPRNPQDLLVIASASSVMVLDNVSHLDAETSDTLAVISTGATRAARALYTNADISMTHVRASVWINGISDFVTRGDLADRTITIAPPTIPPEERRSESDLAAALAQDAPRIMRGFLDRVSATFVTLPSVELQKRERGRMADLENTGEALCRALGDAPGTFAAMARRNASTANSVVLDASPLATALLRFAQDRAPCRVTAGEMLDALAPLVGDRAARAPGWPRTPGALGTAVRRLAPALRRAGLEVKGDRDHGGRYFTIQQLAEAVTAVTGRHTGAPPNLFQPPDSPPACENCAAYPCSERSSKTTICSDWRSQ